MKTGNQAFIAMTPSQRQAIRDSLPESRSGKPTMHDDGVFEFEYSEHRDGLWGVAVLKISRRGKVLSHTWCAA